jgi:hypothetical protein
MPTTKAMAQADHAKEMAKLAQTPAGSAAKDPIDSKTVSNFTAAPDGGKIKRMVSQGSPEMPVWPAGPKPVRWPNPITGGNGG